MNKRTQISPLKLISVSLVFLCLIVSGMSYYQTYESNTNTLTENTNYQFDVAIGNIAEQRLPTEYDVNVGSAKSPNGEMYYVYKSKTLVTNDFNKLFVGDRV